MDPVPRDQVGETVVSIIIVHYRSPEILARCLEMIARAAIALPHETLLVDNAPLDDAARGLAACHGARYLPNERNVGYGRAVNQGMAAAAGRYFLILNPDVEVRAGSVEALVAFMEAHPAAGICGPKLFSPDGSLQYSARTSYTLKIILLRRTPLGRLFPRARALRDHLMMDWDHDSVRDVDWMLGGALLARRAAVDDVGGMDERFFLYFEDVDWCSRMRRRGWRVVYLPDAQMVHAHQRASARGFLRRGQRMHIGSALRFYEKWSMVLYLWKRKSTEIRAGATLLTDLVALSLAFLAAYLTRVWIGGFVPGLSEAERPVFSLGAYTRFVAFGDLVAVGTFTFLGLYRGEVWRNPWREAFQLVKGIAITSLVVLASTFLFTRRPLSRLTILLYFPYGLVALTLTRHLLRRLVAGMRGRQLQMKRLAVFATREQIALLRARFARHGFFGYEPVYLAHDDERTHPPAVDAVARRLALIEDERIAEIAIFDAPGDRPLLDQLLPRLQSRGLPMFYVPHGEAFLLDAHRVGDFMGFGTVTLGGRPPAVASWLKRCTDLACAALLLLCGLPLHLLQLLRLARPAVVTRPVVGRKGSVFGLRVYREPGGLAARIPALAYYPALLNILAGEMSFVGLIPLGPEAWRRMPEAYRLHPPDAPVGLFSELGGAVQLTGEAARLTGDQVFPYNRRYTKSWSLDQDLRILVGGLQRMGSKEGGGP